MPGQGTFPYIIPSYHHKVVKQSSGLEISHLPSQPTHPFSILLCVLQSRPVWAAFTGSFPLWPLVGFSQNCWEKEGQNKGICSPHPSAGLPGGSLGMAKLQAAALSKFLFPPLPRGLPGGNGPAALSPGGCAIPRGSS